MSKDKLTNGHNVEQSKSRMKKRRTDGVSDEKTNGHNVEKTRFQKGTILNKLKMNILL